MGAALLSFAIGVGVEVAIFILGLKFLKNKQGEILPYQRRLLRHLGWIGAGLCVLPIFWVFMALMLFGAEMAALIGLVPGALMVGSGLLVLSGTAFLPALWTMRVGR
jgi:hypothetical protein